MYLSEVFKQIANVFLFFFNLKQFPQPAYSDFVKKNRTGAPLVNRYRVSLWSPFTFAPVRVRRNDIDL